ncbi:MAG: AmmeMemoRadiSam system radical SAM enzyme [Dictyoglomus sp. NZ13-RE01]|nr:MAG: AmmeMemoRadiSam system radical SAM enzyme [Dictyoglomus sp. NZ13-RE01]
MKEALFYRKLEDRKVQCLLCPHHCVIDVGHRGICGVRENIDGILYSLNYKLISSIALDPIEKKPLYHYHPGRLILSIGTVGCNFKCPFCQNWTISQVSPEEIQMQEIDSKKIVEIAKKNKSFGIAYTYNEPFIWYEFVFETSKLAKEEGLENVLVTNGYVEEEPFLELAPYISAMNIDLKAFSQNFYSRLCQGKLDKVLNIISLAYSKRIHIEITTLIIPSWNDSEEEIEKIVDFIASIDKNIPFHMSRYFPAYKFTLPPTPYETLKRLYLLAKKKLNYVYLGNVWDIETSTTYCPNCGKELIVRDGYNIRKNLVTSESKCPFCGELIPIIL